MRKGRIWGGIKVKAPWAGAATVDPGQAIRMAAPARVYLPMGQHIGAPAEPAVKVGDAVCIGQMIGKPREDPSAAVHASVSGTVQSIREMDIGGKPSLVVAIDNDGRDTHCPPVAAASVEAMAHVDIIRHLRDSGIVGMGGATFPTHVKLDVKPGQIDTVLLNGSECEPLIAADDVLMCTRADAVLEGCRLVMRITGAQTAHFGIEDNKPGAVEAMQSAAQADGRITVVRMPTRYPHGGEKQLIEMLTGREVPEGALPSAVGVVVVNVATAAAIADYLLRGLVLTHRLCTIAGDVRSPRTVRFPIGTPAEDLLAMADGPMGMPTRVVQGGPMMGKTLDTLSAPMLKGANGLILFAGEHLPAAAEQPCIRCNRCAEVCPMRLLPLFLDDAYRKEDLAACKRLHAGSCINCGCCTYACPAGRRLAEMITEAGAALKKKQKEDDTDD